MIREVGETIGRAVLDGIGRAASRVQERRSLAADVLENEDAFLVVFDAPGAMASDVAVRFEGQTLHVKIDRFREFHEGYEMRFPGRGLALGGEVTLPEETAVDPEGAEATVTRDGTLEVRIPKAEPDGEAAEAEAEDIETEAAPGEGETPADG